MTSLGLLLKCIVPIAAAIFVVDRFSKWWVVERMDLARLLEIDVMPPYLNFRMAWNTGINFGIGGGGPDDMRWILIAIALAIVIGMTVWALRRGGLAIAIGAGMIAGGALGNAYDRVIYGAVADFLNMSCCGIQNPYAFNVADIAIFAGALWTAFKA